MTKTRFTRAVPVCSAFATLCACFTYLIACGGGSDDSASPAAGAPAAAGTNTSGGSSGSPDAGARNAGSPHAGTSNAGSPGWSGASPGGSANGGASSIAGGANGGASAGTSSAGGYPSNGGNSSTGGGAGSAGNGGAASPLPARVVAGYYPNWTPSPVRIKDVNANYNVIYLFAATPVGGAPGTTGAVTWDMPGDGRGAATNFNADIAYARSTQRRKIILSVGGANNGMSFPSRTKSQAFLESISSWYTKLGGFDGLDWNTFEASQTPDTSEMIWISQQLKTRYPGFLITAPPAPWNSVDKTFCAAMVAAGALDYAAPQYYDGPGLAEQSYLVTNVAEWLKLVGADKLVVGFGIAAQENYMSISDAVSTWKVLAQATPTLRGAFDWQIHTDEAQGWPFATQLGPLVLQ